MKLIQIADCCICCGNTQLTSSPAILMPFVAMRALGFAPVEITQDWGMRDLKQGTSYMPCHSLQCQACGVLFLNYRFTDAQMTALYRGYRDNEYTQERDFFEPGYAAHAAQDYLQRHPYITDVETKLAPHLPNQPVILDWGGSDGLNTPFLGQAQIFVYDISGADLKEGVKAFQLGMQPPPPRANLIVCAQVLEHVSSPIDFLMSITPHLSASTLLYLEVPHEALMREYANAQGLAALKRHWHEHINFFTPASLLQLTQRVGLQCIDTFCIPFNNGNRQGQILGLLTRLKPPYQQ